MKVIECKMLMVRKPNLQVVIELRGIGVTFNESMFRSSGILFNSIYSVNLIILFYRTIVP